MSKRMLLPGVRANEDFFGSLGMFYSSVKFKMPRFDDETEGLYTINKNWRYANK